MKFKSEDINLLQLARNIKYMILLGQVTTEMTSHKTSIPQLSATIWAVLVLPDFLVSQRFFPYQHGLFGSTRLLKFR